MSKEIQFSNPLISLVNEKDLTSIDSLVNSAFRGESSKQGWTTEEHLLGGIRTNLDQLKNTFEEGGSYMLKYTLEHKIVGIVNLKKRESDLYLGMLTVDPGLQNAGIGKQLLKASEEVASQLHLNTIAMTVISVRSELIAWYERHGYILTGEKAPFPMGNPDFGMPKQELEFVVLKKFL
jgi:ribosomal protein S18 acetylase RimI-like enzyme